MHSLHEERNHLKEQRLEMERQLIKEEYEHLKALYGIGSRGWSEIHQNFSRYAFCPGNQRSLIAEYFIWEDFVERAKKYDVPYYMGIDTFLEEYKKAVYSHVKIDEED